MTATEVERIVSNLLGVSPPPPRDVHILTIPRISRGRHVRFDILVEYNGANYYTMGVNYLEGVPVIQMTYTIMSENMAMILPAAYGFIWDRMGIAPDLCLLLHSMQKLITERSKSPAPETPDGSSAVDALAAAETGSVG